MSTNERRFTDEYTKLNSTLGHKVFRPKSMRAVNPYIELNKLYKKIKLLRFLRDDLTKQCPNGCTVKQINKILEAYIDMR